jgi:hypothetical protein
MTTMFRYRLTVEHRDAHGDSTYSQTQISRLTPLTRAQQTRICRTLERKHPDYQSLEVAPVEESDYQQFKAFHNRHED